MFEPDNKIIIVDDIQEHLDRLSQPFKDIGLGCTSFKYDPTYNAPLNSVRVAFFDIILSPSGGGSDAQKYNELATAIKQYIASDNGPYLLIFWTSNKGRISEIKKYIQDVHPNCPKPFLVDYIDKDVFLSKPFRLKNKLQKLLDNKTLNMLLEFENTAASAASKTVEQLYEIIPGKDVWGKTGRFQLNCEKVFSKIAVQNLGYEDAKTNPDKGVIQSLLPMLNHHVESSEQQGKWKSYLITLEKARSPKDVKYPGGFSEDKLNTLCHIQIRSNIDKSERGSVIKVDSGEPFQTHFGVQYATWFAKLLPGVTRANRAQSTVIAVEISASCDYSQKKPRLNRYMLGILLPANAAKEIDKKKVPQYLMTIDGFFSTDSKFKICLNLNYVFSAFKDDPRLKDPLFVLKKEMMDQIGNRYANHVSRIGIISF